MTEMEKRKGNVAGVVLASMLWTVGAQAQYFERVFDSNGSSDTALSLVQAPDGGYYIAGSAGVSQSDYRILRTDQLGLQLWESTSGQPQTNEYLREVVLRGTSGFTAAGNSYVVSGNDNGTFNWWELDMLPQPGLGRPEGVRDAGSGNTINCGTWTDGNDRQATLLLRNSLGDTIWTRMYGASTTVETATSVTTTANGYAFIGLRNGLVTLTLTDINGNPTSFVGFSAFGLVEGGMGSIKGPFSLRNTADGGFIFMASTTATGQPTMRVVKTDAAGNVQWTYDVTGGASGPSGSVRQDTDGTYYLVTGLRQSWDDQYRLTMQRLSASGVLQASHSFQTGHRSYGTDIVRTSTGYAACGIIETYPGSNSDFYLVCTDPNLMVNNSPCQLVAATNLSPGGCGGTLVYTSNGGQGAFYVSLNDVVLATIPAGTLPIAPGGYSFMITNVLTDGCIDSYEDSVFVSGGFVVDAGTYIMACQTAQTMNSIVTPSGQYSYSWEPAYLFDDPTTADPLIVANCVEVLATLTVTDGSGCAVSDTVTVTHVEALTDSYDLCSGPVTLDFGAGAFTYNWQYFTPAGGGATQSINQLTQTYTATQAGTYIGYAGYPYCGTITSVVTVNACAQSCWNEFTQTINPQGCLTQVCFISTGSPTIMTYDWVIDGISMATTANPCITLSAGSHNVTLTTVDDQGCTAQTTHTVFITTGLLGSVGSDTVTACMAPAALSVNVTGGSGNYTYLWSPDSNLSGNGQPSVTVSQVHDQWYTVTVTDNVSGCTFVDSVLASSNIGLAEDTVYLCSDSVLLDMGPGATFYNWGSISSNYWSQTAYVSQPGQYVVYAIYPNGCTAITSVLHVLPCNSTCYSAIAGNLTYAACEATSCVTVTGSPAISEVQWSNGSTGLQTCYPSLGPGDYTITANVLHVDGCTSVATFQVTVPQFMTAGISQDTIACGGQLFGLGMNPVGGSSNYAYNWQPQGLLTTSNQATTSLNQTLTEPLWVFCTVTDNLSGCIAIDSVLIYPNIAQNQTLSQCDAPLVLSVDPGSMVYNWTFTDQGGGPFNWGINTNTTTAFYAGTYTCMTYYSGCNQVIHTFTVDTCLDDDVWPGDANSDNIVSNTDALWVGIAFNQTGPIRAGATLNWVGQPCADWAFDFSAISENLKHADCNGNGMVNYADTIAITQNYNLTHNKTEDEASGSGPMLWIQAIQDTVGLNQGIDFTVNLATATIPVDSLHGVSFTLTFDFPLAQQSGLYLHHDGNVLGAVGTNALSFQKASFIDGAIDVALSRTTGVNFNGFGPVATGRIVTTDNLAGIQEMHIGVSNVTALTAHGLEVVLQTAPDSVVIDPNKTGINETTDLGVVVAPNPSNGPIALTVPTGSYNCVLLDATGRLVHSQSIVGPRAVVDPGHLASGSYTLHLIDATGPTATVLIMRAE